MPSARRLMRKLYLNSPLWHILVTVVIRDLSYSVYDDKIHDDETVDKFVKLFQNPNCIFLGIWLLNIVLIHVRHMANYFYRCWIQCVDKREDRFKYVTI